MSSPLLAANAYKSLASLGGRGWRWRSDIAATPGLEAGPRRAHAGAEEGGWP